VINIIEQANSLETGFDENRISVDNNDIGSIIAYAQNSNLYITGLQRIEYMNIQQNLKGFSEKDSDTKNSTEFKLKNFR